MAFKSKTAGTKIVLLNLLQCLLVFYTLYYMIGSVCFGAFRLNSFDGLIPFDFKTQAAKSNSKYLVNLLSMELTYFTSGILFAIIVKKWVWDYSITVTLIHVILSSAGGGLLMMICNGQLVAHCVCQNNPAYSSSNL
ncbi:transmembrane protein 244-like isoform X3 [Chiloscyllium plagiosum]|uniref:transmembrane protein 244-like isoform X3 n=1 Tax=Chiloscyllium plagiosum TaxID=36176 RepID=UPI001CB80C4C|nr:transmembrane protein 244-like isoform X3 [Chiloscyllium plagiosum]